MPVCDIAALAMMVKRRTALTFTMLIAIMAGGFVYASQYVFPALNEFNSAKPFSLKIKSMLKEGDLVASFCQKNDAFIFYSGVREIKELETPSAMATLFMKSPQRVFCLMYKRDFDRIAAVLPFRIYRWEEGRVEDREFIIVSNHERS